MHFEPNEIYHVYNQGNNWQRIFFNDSNYTHFLKKLKQEWKSYCEILCYCLIPNCFDLILVPNEIACCNIVLGDKVSHMQVLSKLIGKTLSSYTRAINIQNHSSGSLFQKKTKCDCLSLSTPGQPTDRLIIQHSFHTCFDLIHEKPVQAKLVRKPWEWEYCSYRDYYGFRSDTLCNKKLAIELGGLLDIGVTSSDRVEPNTELNNNSSGLSAIFPGQAT